MTGPVDHAVATDAAGMRHELRVVDHPHGAVTLLDGEERRTMAPAAAIDLACRLVLACRRYVPGAISGGF